MGAVRSSLVAFLVVACLGTTGCFLSHAFVDEELDGGRRPDSGSALVDAGDVPRFDAGDIPRFDAGDIPRIDAGPGRRDAGDVPRIDAGPGRRDAGPPPPPPDAGPPPPFDAGPPRRDAGPPPPPPDAGPGPDAGRPSIALGFETSDQLVVAAAPSLDLTHAFTVELWIRVRAPLDGFLVRKGDPAGGRFMYGMRLEGAAFIVGWGVESGVRHELTATLPTWGWHHVAFVAQERGPSIEASLYIDATLVASFTGPNDLPSAVNDFPFIVGAAPSSFDVDDIRIWSLARDATTIAAFYRSRIDPGLAGLEAYLPLEESGQLALDRTLHGHEGVLGRMTTADDLDPRWIADGAL